MNVPRLIALALLRGALMTWIGGVLLPAGAAERVQYNRDVRPILSDACFLCHGPDQNTRKAKLRLDERDNAISRKAIVPGKPAESELIARILTSDADDVMPPPDSHKTLTQPQKDLLVRWISEGAEYQAHWAYVPPTRPAIPAVTNTSRITNPIDAFVLARLESRGVSLSPEADRATLLRRLSLDLIGLPPTPDEVRGFLNDTSPRAYENQVDRLLASPHYGERMAVPWLDLVRFADTVGFHGDQNQNSFPYREYVINAFNSNKPFDTFTREQIAGDLLPGAGVEQRVASGFNRLNMMTREGGAQAREYLAKYQADRVRTVGTTWLGSTLGCAECHDHKYDPFTMRDFYSLSAYFADLKQWGVYADYDYTPNPELKGWSNDHPFPPEILVPSPYLAQRELRLTRARDALVAARFNAVSTNDSNRAEFRRWRRSASRFLAANPEGWVTPRPEVTLLTTNKTTPKRSRRSPESNGAPAVKTPAKPASDTAAPAKTNSPALPPGFTLQRDATVVFSGTPAVESEFRFPRFSGTLAALRLELIPHPAWSNSIVRKPGSSTGVSLSARVIPHGGDRTNKLAFAHAEAFPHEPRWNNGYEIIGVRDSWKTAASKHQQTHTAVYQLDAPVVIGAGDELVIKLNASQAGAVRISLSPFHSDEPLLSPWRARLAQALHGEPEDPSLPLRAFTLSSIETPDLLRQINTLSQEIRECRSGRSLAMVSESIQPFPVRVLPRGNWQDESGKLVDPAPPLFLARAGPADAITTNAAGAATPPRSTRLDLANWLVAPENPLTSRVFINRLWRQMFGNGFSSTVDDFGAQGEWPTHPDLLDWLSVEFREGGWDIKRMVKLLVMSSTYRQSSNLRPELRESDPGNRLLSSQNPRRLEAEFVRDNALFAAGLLSPDLGGPSARPYQPGGYYVNLQFPDRDYIAHNDDRQYRRGLYTHWQRTFLHPMLANFDAPAREECTATRNTANTPQQALTLLNDPTFVEAARAFASRAISAAPRDPARLTWVFQQLLARDPRPRESEALLRFLEAQRTAYTAAPADASKLLKTGLAPAPETVPPAELAAWTSLCRVVLNLHETITRY